MTVCAYVCDWYRSSTAVVLQMVRQIHRCLSRLAFRYVTVVLMGGFRCCLHTYARDLNEVAQMGVHRCSSGSVSQL